MKGVPLTTLAFACAMTAGPGLVQHPTPLVAAHRGGALLWPENSLLAFRSAVALGADYLELDVHVSKDGEVVVIHDPTLDRTSTGAGAVRDWALAELKALRLKDRAGAVTAESIPSLDDVVAVAAAGKRGLLVEIKVDERRQRYPGVEEKTLAILDRHGMAASTVVMAFEAETWRRVHTLRPDVRVGALYSAKTLEPGPGVLRAIEDARATGVAHVGLQHALVTPEAVAQARSAGILLGAWTVNDPDVMRRVIDLQVGILTTDRPDMAMRLLNDRRRNP